MLPKDLLRALELGNPLNIVIGHLNINSIRNKFESLKDLIGESIEILLISETKLDATFPEGQFKINGFYLSFREDRNDKGVACFYMFVIISLVGD